MRILTSRIADPSRWKLWNLTVEDGKDWGRHLTIDSSDVVQWSIGMYARLLKKLPKAVLELPFLRGCLPAFVLGLRVYRHCTLIFLGGRLPCPPPLPCSRPLREGWICRGGNPGNSARPLSHLPQKTLRQSADWYCYLARLDSRREKSYLSRPAKAGKPETGYDV
jgi:hypothetical protein